MSASAHPEEVLQDFLDGRLTGTAADDVRGHLETCGACQAVRDELMLARDALATLRDDEISMPADLLASVQRALDVEVDRAAGAPAAGTPVPATVLELTAVPSEETRATWAATRRRRWFAVAAAAALVVYVALGRGTTPLDLPAQVARDAGAVGSRSLPLGLQSSDAAALERYFADAPNGPRVRVIDLGMMGIPLEGGVRHVLNGQSSALYAYRTPSGARLVCQMYVGRLSDLPPPDNALDNKGFHFQIYDRGGVTVVFWQEGDLVCVLASELPAGEVIALAFEKAMAPA